MDFQLGFFGDEPAEVHQWLPLADTVAQHEPALAQAMKTWFWFFSTRLRTRILLAVIL